MGLNKVLILEDEVFVAERMADYLVENGYKITDTVISGKDAIESATKNPPDIAVLDIKVEGEMDGIQTARELKKMMPNLPIIFCTAYPEEYYPQAKDINPYAFLSKTNLIPDLIFQVELALRNAFIQPDEKIEMQVDGFFVKRKNVYERVRYEDVVWIGSGKGVVTINTVNSTHSLSSNLNNIEQQLECQFLKRISGSFIVNLRKVTSFSRGEKWLKIGDRSFSVSDNADLFSGFDNFFKILTTRV